MLYVRAVLFGAVFLGFELLAYRALDTVLHSQFFLFLPLLLCGSAFGSALVHHLQSTSRGAAFIANADLVSVALLPLVFGCLERAASAASVPGAWVFAAFAVAFLAMLAWGVAFTALFKLANPLRVQMALALGGLTVVGLPLALDHWGFAVTLKAYLISIAGAVALIHFNKGFDRKGVAGILIMAASVTFGASGRFDVMPRLPALQVYSNSLSQFKITQIPRATYPTTLAPQGRELTAAHNDLRVLSIIRDSREASLIFDAVEWNDLQGLREETTYKLVDLAEAWGHMAIIGAGGGHEILQAQLAGFQQITAIEINSLMVRAVLEQSRNPAFSYAAPNVRTVIQDGRFFFRHLDPTVKFDVISIAHAKHFGGVGVLSYAENLLYTAEAFADYVRHLQPKGLLILRNNSGGPEYYRAIHASLIAGLKQAGADGEGDVFRGLLRAQQTLMFRDEDEHLLVFKKGGFRAEDQVTLRSVAVARSQRVLAAAGDDDRPYAPWFGRLEHSWTRWVLALLVLAPVLGLWFWWVGRSRHTRESWLWVYAFLSGLAYCGVQTAFIDRAIHVTGQPTLALVTVLSAFLLASVFAFWSVDRPPRWVSRPEVLFVVIAVSGLTYGALIGSVRLPFSQQSFLLLTWVLSFVPATLASVAFALYFRVIGPSSAIPWVLCCNGIGALLGGLQTKFVSLTLGWTAAVVVALVMYACAWVSTRHFWPRN